MFHMCRCSSVRWKPKSTPPAQSCLIPIPYVSNPNPVADSRLSCSLMDLGWVWSRSKEENHGLQIKRSTMEEKEWRNDAQYQIPDQGSIGHTKDQQSNKEEEKSAAFFQRNLSHIFCLRSKATWLQKCTEMQWNKSWWQKGKRRCSALALALAILWIVGTLSKAPPQSAFLVCNLILRFPFVWCTLHSHAI